MPSKHGFDYCSRFDFWAENKKGMEGVAFLSSEGYLVVPLYRVDEAVHCYSLVERHCITVHISELMPLFPRAVRGLLQPSSQRAFDAMQVCVRDFCNIREDWLAMTKPAEKEAMDELYTDSVSDAWAHAWTAGTGKNPFRNKSEEEKFTWGNKRGNPFVIKTPEGKDRFFVTRNSDDEVFISKEDLQKARIQIKQNETEDMKNTVKTGMVNVNKEAIAQVGYLNAGRASNKVIKEAVRPLLNAMFKPTFMQKIAMKLFNMQNPVDVALKSSVSDILCAQMVHAIVEIKGVENENVRKVTQAGITYSMLELSQQIPFEDAMDKVVASLEKGADSVFSKISK